MKKKRVSTILITALLLLTTLTGCASGVTKNDPTNASASASTSTSASTAETSNPTVQPPTQKMKTELNIRTTFDIATIDPHWTIFYTDFYITNQVWEGLVRFAAGDVTKFEGVLAESWEINDEFTEFTFHLRQGVTFSDGTPFVAEDVVFSLERMAVSSGMGNKVRGVIEKCEVLDPTTVKVTTTSCTPQFLGLMASHRGMIVSKEVCGRMPDPMAAIALADRQYMIGTGAYMIDTITPGEGASLVSNKNHYWGEPYFERLNFLLVADDSTAVSAFLNGELDQVQINTRMDKELIEADSNFKTNEIRMSGIHTIAINNSVKPFVDNLALRQAIAYGTNEEVYGEMAFDGIAVTDKKAIISVFDEGEEAYSEDYETYEYNVEKAKAKLAEAGYAPGELTLTMSTSTNMVGTAAATVFQQQMKDIGINVEVLPLQPGAFQQLQMSGEFQIAYILFCSIPYDAPGFHGTFFQPSGIAFFLQFDNPEFQALIAATSTAKTLEERIALYKEAHTLISPLAYYIPMARAVTVMAISGEIRGDSFEPAVLTAKYRDWYMSDYEGFYDPYPGLD